MTLSICLMLPLLTALGFWQLDRGAQKRAMEMDYLGQLTALPVNARQLDNRQRFQRVKLRGRFGHEVFLVDNQIYRGRSGYWVVQVFNDVSGLRFLVNRGFVPAPEARHLLPQLAALNGEYQLVGALWPFTGLVPLLDEDPWSRKWPKRVQRLDVRRMAAVTGAQPMEIRLEPGQPGVSQAAPFASVLSDSKHLGYAATWFGLAAVLLIGFVFFGFGKRA